MAKRIAILAPLWATMAIPLAVRAEPPKPATSAEIQAEGDLVRKAIAKSKAGDHDSAIQLYLNAYDVVPQPILLSNIGTEYEQSDRPQQALNYFCKYLAAEPNGTNAAYAIAKAKALEAELGLPPADDGRVCMAATPKANEPAPTSSPPTSSASPGTTATPLPEPVDRPNHSLQYTGAAVGAVGAVGVVLGIVFGVKAKHLSDAITHHDPRDPWPPTIDGVSISDWDSQGRAWNRDTYIFAIGGGLALAAGAALVVVGTKHSHGTAKPADAAISIVPVGAGLAALGHF